MFHLRNNDRRWRLEFRALRRPISTPCSQLQAKVPVRDRCKSHRDGATARHKLQQLEIIGSMGAHPAKVHAPKDIETFKGLLAELGAGWRGGVMEGAWLDNPRRLHR